MLISVLGAIAALLTIVGFVPQAWRIIKTRNTRDLSTGMWICSTTAFALWSVYGIALGQWPLIVPNVVCFVLAAFILAATQSRRIIEIARKAIVRGDRR